jgi:hypothetical protein
MLRWFAKAARSGSVCKRQSQIWKWTQWQRRHTWLTFTMKYLSTVLSLASLAAASPLFGGSDGGQVPLATYPGFSLDLGAMRLVELEGQPPVWMSELEKVG